MEKINETISNFFLLHLNIEKILKTYNTVVSILIPITIIYMIIFTISLFMIFKKENINPLFALIPVYRFYLYYKIIKLPFILYFIPIVNVVMFIVSPYRLAHQYKCNDFIKAISIFIPFIIVPYIAFSKLENRDKVIDFRIYKTGEDIDNLETKLINDTDSIIIEDDNKIINIKKKKNEKEKEDFIEKFNYDKVNDEYVEDEEFIQQKEVDNTPEETNKIDEFEEVEDEEQVKNVNVLNLDELDERLTNASAKDTNLNTNIVDYKEEAKKSMDIAFGGEKEKATVQVQLKNDTMVCKKCGSRLSGSDKACPGCGAPIE